MHDTHLIEKIYESIARICRQNSVIKVNGLYIELFEGSHIYERLLLSHLRDKDRSLFGPWADVHIDYRPFESLTAVITSIDGDCSE